MPSCYRSRSWNNFSINYSFIELHITLKVEYFDVVMNTFFNVFILRSCLLIRHISITQIPNPLLSSNFCVFIRFSFYFTKKEISCNFTIISNCCRNKHWIVFIPRVPYVFPFAKSILDAPFSTPDSIRKEMWMKWICNLFYLLHALQFYFTSILKRYFKIWGNPTSVRNRHSCRKDGSFRLVSYLRHILFVYDDS